jgi:hypothetical protein
MAAANVRFRGKSGHRAALPLVVSAATFAVSGDVVEKIGGRTRTRTLDPLIKSQLLYQLSYAPGLL